MARKSIKGYAEKNYYDNTRFKGITATTDPLNEGYFKHLVNFDIADTGQSITPRKGMKTYDLTLSDGTYVTLEKDTIYFRDSSTGLYIFCCFNKHHSGDPVEPYFTAYKTDFITTMPISVDSTLQPSEFTPIETYAKTIYDHYQIQRNICKVKLDEGIKFINFTYRAENTSYEGTTYSEDTLVIDIVNTEDIGSIDTSQRNIASTQSVIPNPMQTISADVLVNKFPMIYVKTSEGKYAINTVTTLEDVELIPYFELKPDDWGYMYDITSTYTYATDNIVYSSPLYDLDTNEPIINPDVITYHRDNYVNRTGKVAFEYFKDNYYDSSVFDETLIIYVVPNYNTNPSYEGPIPIDKSYNDNTEIDTILTDIFSVPKSDNAANIINWVSGIPDIFTYDYFKNQSDTVKDRYSFYIKAFKDVLNTTYRDKSKDSFCRESFLDTTTYISTEPPIDYNEFLRYIQDTTYNNIIFIACPSIQHITLNSRFDITEQPNTVYNIFPSYIEKTPKDYFILYPKINSSTSKYIIDGITSYPFLLKGGTTVKHSVYAKTSTTLDNPGIDSLFTYDDNILKFKYDSDNVLIKELNGHKFFDNGLIINLYLFKKPLPDTDTYYNALNPNIIKLSSLVSSRQLVYSEHPTYYIEVLTQEPKDILSEATFIVFNDRIVTWINNTVYMSEENAYYYFKHTGVYNYPERVIKALAYKDTVLVFTTQNLYCIYPYEYTTNVQDGVDDEGKSKYVQQKVIAYASLPVLYNLMVDEKYADAIQVFNQMILFYSADGQLFMIKPTASIDSNTRFSVQFFNKSANDILANYDLYINERREAYRLDPITKEDIDIKVECTLTHIKIYYTMSDYTYILIYDVIDNYYYVYDTVVLYGIQNIIPTDGYDNIIISDENRIHFSTVHKEVKNVDKGLDQTHLIKMELDTGTINLNNHLKKRFRTLHTTYKNIDADSLKYNLEVLIDDVPAYTTHEDVIELEENSYTSKTISNEVDLLAHNTLLFHFTEDSLNKIITHRSNIVSVGKTIRLKTTFESAGRFKLNGYGLIYKEHQI